MELFSVMLLPTEVHYHICTVLTVIEIRLYSLSRDGLHVFDNYINY